MPALVVGSMPGATGRALRLIQRQSTANAKMPTPITSVSQLGLTSRIAPTRSGILCIQFIRPNRYKRPAKPLAKARTPTTAVIAVENYVGATVQIALTTLRSVLGQSDLDEVLAHREEINEKLRQIIDEQTEKPWGVLVTVAEVKDVLLPESMQRAMARQAEAERERRAKVVHAHGEYQAAGTLAEAADIISQHPVALQLRYLQTMVEMASEKTSTIIPIPLEIFGVIRDLQKAVER